MNGLDKIIEIKLAGVLKVEEFQGLKDEGFEGDFACVFEAEFEDQFFFEAFEGRNTLKFAGWPSL